LTRLADMVSALGQGSQLHPQSVAGAIALAKKYCRDDKLDIQWHEFLADEVAKLRSFFERSRVPHRATQQGKHQRTHREYRCSNRNSTTRTDGLRKMGNSRGATG
jgi:hypothetical protein